MNYFNFLNLFVVIISYICIIQLLFKRIQTSNMIKELYNDADYRYCIAKEFKPEFLEPIGKFVLWKLKNEWDDYNELYHATAFFEKIRYDKDLWIDSHLMLKNETIEGSAFVIGGNIQKAETRVEIYEERKSLLFKYFHVVEKGKGFGQKWLSKIIIPYYRNLGYQSFYITSSHPKSFPLYKKLGHCLDEYTTKSDNKLFERKGLFFEIDLKSDLF
jgi:hypothetical protein